MTDGAPHNFPLSEAAVLIVAHGSPHSPGGSSATRRHAQNLTNMKIFGKVAVGFLTEKPFVADVLKDLDASQIYIVPNLVTTGYIFQKKIPIALGLTGSITERITPKGHQRLILTDPVGTHPFITRIMAETVQASATDLDINLDDTALFVIGHGSEKSRASYIQTAKVAAEMALFGLGELSRKKAIFTAFLEEVPYVHDWRAVTDARTIIFAPYLISDGFHAHRDIPLAIGFDPNDEGFQSNLRARKASETSKEGTRLVYLAPIGTAPGVVDIMYALVKQARYSLMDR
ncbi:MAG: hypothetical protein JKY17_06240 [Magnetovibrio sp.]|nr:hypothetical protein [Magnetovibrio sp.]